MEKETIGEMESFGGFGNEKFKIVSRIYGNKFGTVTLIVFNTETGDLRKHVFKNEETDLNYDNEEEGEREIRADTAKNIQGEINRLSHKYPNEENQYIWNHAIRAAAECCNGYEQED